jgi:cytochrome c oxidase cbb3-type subunit 4
MDMNDLRIAVTVLSFVTFIGIFVWAWQRRNAAGFSEAAQLPFLDSVPSDEHASTTQQRSAP